MEPVGDVGGIEGTSGRRGEYETLVVPPATSREPFFDLPPAMLTERTDELPAEAERPP